MPSVAMPTSPAVSQGTTDAVDKLVASSPSWENHLNTCGLCKLCRRTEQDCTQRALASGTALRGGAGRCESEPACVLRCQRLWTVPLGTPSAQALPPFVSTFVFHLPTSSREVRNAFPFLFISVALSKCRRKTRVTAPFSGRHALSGNRHHRRWEAGPPASRPHSESPVQRLQTHTCCWDTSSPGVIPTLSPLLCTCASINYSNANI